ncbi:MAG: RND family efflux transporter MFP subunit [Gammaproteobacteria bacterium]
MMQLKTSNFRRVLCSLVLLAPAVAAQAQPQAALVDVDAVQIIISAQTSDVIGRIVARRQGQVAVRTDGSIFSIPVAMGDHVEKGQILAELDDDLLRAFHALAKAELDGAGASLKTAEAKVGLATQAVRRLSKLSGTIAATQAALEDAQQQQRIEEAEVGEARVEVRRKEIDLAIAEARVDYAQVYAPYDGIVIEKIKEIGDYARKGDAMFYLVGDRELEIEASVFASLIRGIQPDQHVNVITSDGHELQAVVRALLPVENDRTRTRTVRFSVSSQAVDLTPGEGVTLKLPSGPVREFLSVHKDAVIYQSGQSTVYVVMDGKAQPRQVKLGGMSGIRFEVIDGLLDGDKAIIRGNERLRPDQSVRVSGTDS